MPPRSPFGRGQSRIFPVSASGPRGSLTHSVCAVTRNYLPARRGPACRLGCQRRAPAALAAASLMSGGGHPPFGRASSDSFLGHPALAHHLYAGSKTIWWISRNGSTCPFLNREQICSSRLWLNERGRQLRRPISPSRSLRVCSALLTSRFQTSAI